MITVGTAHFKRFSNNRISNFTVKMSYQKVNAFNNIEENFILTIFDTLGSPRDSISYSRWGAWGDLHLMCILCNKPELGKIRALGIEHTIK